VPPLLPNAKPLQVISQILELAYCGKNVFIHTQLFTALLDFFRDYLGDPAPERQNQEGKTNLDLPEQEMVIGSGIGWAICKSAP